MRLSIEASLSGNIYIYGNQMKEEKPLIDTQYLLQKFPGKSGWTYAEIPEVIQDKTKPFGWVNVKGTIDGFELNQYKLMPMGNGKLFLPVKLEIRKKIKKQAGDFVRIVLYSDKSSLVTPSEIIECLENESTGIKETFDSFSEGDRKAYLDWIYGAKTDKTKAKRIVKMIERLEKKLKFHDPE